MNQSITTSTRTGVFRWRDLLVQYARALRPAPGAPRRSRCVPGGPRGLRPGPGGPRVLRPGPRSPGARAAAARRSACRRCRPAEGLLHDLDPCTRAKAPLTLKKQLTLCALSKGGYEANYKRDTFFPKRNIDNYSKKVI